MQEKEELIFNEMDEIKTEALAQKISSACFLGDIILLEGKIGSGKTFFARAFIQQRIFSALGRIEDIPSPTFTIVQVYDNISPSIWHIDLYRLTRPEEIVELGLEEAVLSSILLIEWPEKLGQYRPIRSLLISFEESESSESYRTIKFRAFGTKWDHVFKTLA